MSSMKRYAQALAKSKKPFYQRQGKQIERRQKLREERERLERDIRDSVILSTKN